MQLPLYIWYRAPQLGGFLETQNALHLGFAFNPFQLTAIGANPDPNPDPDNYSCRLMISAKDLPQGMDDARFRVVGPSTSSHGGTQYTFTFGKNKLWVLANARWRGIVWQRDDALIAHSITAAAEDSLNSLVLVVYNARDPEENVSLECEPSMD
ncbi:MAG: hypothetical protein HC902_00420 [Calothrix sp. SM1_5_4]|nr:hypothetical protein [Calothrix sp. SM1_5_4]